MDDDRAGLCASCVSAQLVTSSRGSTFYLCRLSFTDPRFPRYPPLPVLTCAGYDPRPVESRSPNPDPEPDRQLGRARILITSWGSFGDVYPYVGLALALKARGHWPVIAMPEFYRALIETLGFEFRAVGPMIDPDDRATIARVMDPIRGADALVKGILMPSLRADYAALDAAARDVDLIVTHPITFAGPIIAQARALPWVSTVLAPMSFFSPTDVPGPLTGAVSCAPGASWPVVRARVGALRTEPHISLDEAGIRSAARTRTAARRSSVVRRTVFAGTHACALLARARGAAAGLATERVGNRIRLL